MRATERLARRRRVRDHAEYAGYLGVLFALAVLTMIGTADWRSPFAAPLAYIMAGLSGLSILAILTAAGLGLYAEKLNRHY